ncbi:hypothetical protein I2F38_13205 [Acinetobacter sp. FNA11]|nr:hypothetical protein [Acinetobacter pollinis]
MLDAKEACESFDLVTLNNFTCNRNIYDDADENGLSVFEMPASDKAKQEIEEIAKEFLGEI